MKPADAISAPARVSLGAVSADVGAIVLTDGTGVCTKVAANTEPKNGKALILLLADFNPAAFTANAPAGPATFDVIDPAAPGIPPAHLAVVTFGVNDSSCAEVAAQSAVATSGSVKLTSDLERHLYGDVHHRIRDGRAGQRRVSHGELSRPRELPRQQHAFLRRMTPRPGLETMRPRAAAAACAAPAG